MRKAKLQNYLKPNSFKHEDLTPKYIVRSPVNLGQRKLPGQSSAFPTNRIRQRDTNIFKPLKPSSPFQSPTKDKPCLSEQQITSSSVYRMLEEQILALITRQEYEFQKLQELKKTKDKEIKQSKQEQHAIKLQIWQLRNETMELKDAIQTEQEQNEKLMEELSITEEDLDNYLRPPEEWGVNQSESMQYNQQQPSTE